MMSSIPIASYVNELVKKGLVPDMSLPAVMLCYGPCLLEDIKAAKSYPFLGARLRKLSDSVSVLEYVSTGAPNLNIYFQIMAQLGLKKLISVGFAGAFDADLNVSDIVSVEKALHDGGSFSGFSLQNSIEIKASIVAKKVCNLSTDNPFSTNDLKSKVLEANKAQTVDMEVALLAGLSQQKAIEFEALLVISDLLSENQWKPGFSEARPALQEAQKMALDELIKYKMMER